MRSVLRKIVAWGLTAALTMSLTACGSAGGGIGDTKSAKAETGAQAKDLIFEGEDYDLKDIEGDPNSFVIAEDKIYFLSVEYSDSEDDFDLQGPTAVYSMNLDGSDLTKVCEPSMDNKEEYIVDLTLDQDKTLYLFSAVRDQAAESTTCYFSRVDKNGRISEHIDLAKATETAPDTYISDVYTDDNGNFLVMTDKSVFVLDKDFKKTAEIRNDKGWLGAIAKTPEGKIFCGISGDDGVTVKEIDVAKGQFGETVKLDLPYFAGSDAMSDGCGDYDFFYNTDDGLFGYSLKENAATQIIDYMASEIRSENSYGIVPVDEETLIGTTWDSSGARITRYKKVDASLVKDKITVTYGALWGVFDEVKDAAIRFNKENDKYRIEFVDYGESEDAQTKMIADILSGDAPDILDLSYVPIEPYVGKGILEDLTPYLEKDETVSKEDILPSAEKAMEIDGKLYYLSSSFNIKTVLASKKDVGDKSGWTFEEFKALLQEKGDEVAPFYGASKAETFGTFVHSCMNDYIDWNTGECSFNSDEFKSILEIANRGTDEETEYDENAPSEAKLIKEGKVLFQTGYASMENLQEFEQLCDSDVTFIGFPCQDKNGSYFSFNNQFGIYSKSKEKDGAWEFIRTFITKEYQAGDGYMFSNPTNQEAFEMYMKSRTATKAYKDEFGHRITPVQESWENEAGVIRIGPASAQEEKMYRDLINNTTKVITFDDSVLEIVKDEANGYFGGQKKLDETADIIQNRITTYVNEKR